MEASKSTTIGGDAPYDRRAAKRATELRVNGDLLDKARELGINAAAALEEALTERISARRRELWLEENREAIEAYNKIVAEQGVFSDGLRGF